jgi:hypothetical protein
MAAQYIKSKKTLYAGFSRRQNWMRFLSSPAHCLISGLHLMKLVPLCLLLLAAQSTSRAAIISDQGVNGGPAYTSLLSYSLSLSGNSAPLPTEFVDSENPVESADIIVAEPASFFASGLGLVALGLLKRRTRTRKRTN